MPVDEVTVVVVPNDACVLVRLAVAGVWFKENPVVLEAVVPVPKVNPVLAEVVALAFNENPVVVVVVGAVVVAVDAGEILNPVAIVLGVPNVSPAAAVDTAASPLPKPNPPVSGLDAKADIVAVVVAGVEVPPKLKLRLLPVDAGVENPVGAVVVDAPEVMLVLVVVPVPNIKVLG